MYIIKIYLYAHVVGTRGIRREGVKTAYTKKRQLKYYIVNLRSFENAFLTKLINAITNTHAIPDTSQERHFITPILLLLYRNNIRET